MPKRRETYDDYIEYVEDGQRVNKYILPRIEGQGELLVSTIYYEDPPLGDRLILSDYLHL